MNTAIRSLEAVTAAPIDSLEGRRLLVLLHGYGADERDLLPIVPALGGDDVVVSLRGPVTLEWGGAAWADGPRDEVLRGAGIGEAADDVLAWLDGLTETPSTVRLLGFSQGGAVALALVRRAPERFDRVVAIAGFVTDEPDAAAPGAPVFWGRGEADPVIPPDAVARTAGWLGTDPNATIRVYPGLGHSISQEELADVAAFLR